MRNNRFHRLGRSACPSLIGLLIVAGCGGPPEDGRPPVAFIDPAALGDPLPEGGLTLKEGRVSPASVETSFAGSDRQTLTTVIVTYPRGVTDEEVADALWEGLSGRGLRLWASLGDSYLYELRSENVSILLRTGETPTLTYEWLDPDELPPLELLDPAALGEPVGESGLALSDGQTEPTRIETEFADQDETMLSRVVLHFPPEVTAEEIREALEWDQAEKLPLFPFETEERVSWRLMNSNVTIDLHTGDKPSLEYVWTALFD